MTIRLLYCLCLLLPVHLANSQGSADTFLITPDNTEIEFQAKHLGVINVSGTFKTFNGHIHLKQNIITSAKITLDVASITTNNHSRDKSLKDPDFLDAKRHPFIIVSFQNNNSPAIIESWLKIRKVDKPVPITYDITQKTQEVREIAATCEISRKQFLLHFGTMDDLISDKIQVNVFVTLKVK